MNVLVVGGAGYIGSHMVRLLDNSGHNVIVLDNLSTGFAPAVTAGELIVGDMADRALTEQVLGDHNIDAVMHFAILNSLRAWNFFDLPEGVRTMSNVGGFGIDGCMSSLIGASLADPNKVFYLVTGDLAFFYDLNALGNRQLGANVRILLVNNGRGTEFTQHGHLGAQFGPDAATFIAAEGHFGPKSPALAKGYAEALGLEYIGVTGKAECTTAAQSFFDPMPRDRPMLLEAFVDADDESDALRMIKTLFPAPRNTVRKAAKDLLGPQKIKAIRKVIKA